MRASDEGRLRKKERFVLSPKEFCSAVARRSFPDGPAKIPFTHEACRDHFVAL
jgi:hypothetical protein